MATTSLIPLHIGKGKTISEALGRTVDYVENPDKTNEGEYISSYECDPLIAEQQFLFTKSQYTALTGRNQGDRNVIAYHLRQSFKPDEITPEIANKIGYDTAMSLTKGKHAFIVCTHVDKAHIHSHIVFNSTALDCTRKFRNFWGSSFAIRRISDRLCLEQGLSIVETPLKSKGGYNTWLGEKPLTFSDKLRLAIDEVLALKPKSFEEFLQLMKDKGFEIKNGKHIAFKGAGQQKFIRLRSLGDGYSEDEIKDVIGGKAIHSPKPKQEKKVDLLIDIQAKLNEGKGKGYEYKANIINAKQKANTINFLREHNLINYDMLSNKCDEICAIFDKYNSEIKTTEKRLAEIKTLKNHIINYMKTKDAYTEYKQSGYSQKIAEKYQTELILHKASKAHFNELGLKKLPTIKSLQEEEQLLFQTKKRAYGEYKKAKHEMQDILNAKANVDAILGKEEVERRKKKSLPER